jgi:exonuclease SbcD
MIKLLHTADIHIGVDSHGRVDPATGQNTRLLDFRRSFDFLVQTALEEDIDLFLFAGDAYRTAAPTTTQQKAFVECLKPVVDAGIPVAMIVGNHDHPVSFGKASALDIFGHLGGTLADGKPQVRVYNRPSFDIVPTKSGDVQLFAFPWPVRSLLLAREDMRGLAPNAIRDEIERLYDRYIRAYAEGQPRDLPTVLMGHFSVTGAELSHSERASLIAHEPKFEVSTLAPQGSQIDYVALGHIHRHQNLNPDADGPPVVYPSSIERVSFKEADETKGFVILELDPDAEPGRRFVRPADPHPVTGVDFRPTPARRFVSIDVNAADAPNPTQHLLAAIGRHDLKGAVVRVRYQVKEDGAAAVDKAAVRAALEAADTVAAIERVVQPIERQRRTVVTRESSLKEAMERYVEQREDLTSVKARMVEAAVKLDEELAAEER